jgi:arylsulfatase
MAYTAPHDPLHAWPEDIAKYEGMYDIGYGAIRRARYAKQVEQGLVDPQTAPLSENEHPDWENLSAEEKRDQARRMEVYAAMIDRMDQNIGKLLNKLRDLGLEDNTLVMFCSDNGASPVSVEVGDGPIGAIDRWSSIERNWANVGNTPLRKYKNWSHEGGVCTPMIARWPAGIKRPGRMTDWPGHFIDFLATFVDVSGADYPRRVNDMDVTPLQGVSFLPVLRDDDGPAGRTLYWEWAGGRAVRRDDWKLVSKRGPWELYNMAMDRTETNNVAKEHPELVKELSSAWETWYAECYDGDPPKFR